MIVDIRFNTNYPQRSQFEWRILVDGEETLVNELRCNVPTYSTSTFIEGQGMKWHLSAEANDVAYAVVAGKKYAEIV